MNPVLCAHFTEEDTKQYTDLPVITQVEVEPGVELELEPSSSDSQYHSHSLSPSGL